jgi:hypothetical protein
MGWPPLASTFGFDGGGSKTTMGGGIAVQSQPFDDSSKPKPGRIAEETVSGDKRGVAVTKPHIAESGSDLFFGTTRIVSQRPIPSVLVYQRGSGLNGGGDCEMFRQGPSGESLSAKKMLCEGPATLLYWLQFSSQRCPLFHTHPLPRLQHMRLRP